MPGKNTIKTYVPNSYYHIYNRGVEKRIIFEDDQDYKVFLKYLKASLSPPTDQESLTVQGDSFKGVPRQPKNYSEEIEMVAYCLMPNHFHFLVKQKADSSMQGFMRSLATRYSMYFNKRYERVGKLFQGPYKAVLVTEDQYLLHLSKYIHTNPAELFDKLESAYSSYAEYLGKRNTPWIKPDDILSYFDNAVIKEIKKINSYKQFVEEIPQDKINSRELLGNLTLE